MEDQAHLNEANTLQQQVRMGILRVLLPTDLP